MEQNVGSKNGKSNAVGRVEDDQGKGTLGPHGADLSEHAEDAHDEGDAVVTALGLLRSGDKLNDGGDGGGKSNSLDDGKGQLGDEGVTNLHVLGLLDALIGSRVVLPEGGEEDGVPDDREHVGGQRGEGNGDPVKSSEVDEAGHKG